MCLVLVLRLGSQNGSQKGSHIGSRIGSRIVSWIGSWIVSRIRSQIGLGLRSGLRAESRNDVKIGHNICIVLLELRELCYSCMSYVGCMRCVAFSSMSFFYNVLESSIQKRVKYLKK